MLFANMFLCLLIIFLYSYHRIVESLCSERRLLDASDLKCLFGFLSLKITFGGFQSIFFHAPYVLRRSLTIFLLLFVKKASLFKWPSNFDFSQLLSPLSLQLPIQKCDFTAKYISYNDFDPSFLVFLVARYLSP